ncbi:MAG: Holliday junction branch migration protein RuvA [Chitinivibrionales bacterium]|nr:Holliday junction branch migration protein RuvA [Chitinivibrionales bacterium]
MIEYVKGILAQKHVDFIVIEAGGVGYGLSIPLTTYEKLPGVEQEVKVLTHHHVREDMQRLFGFSTEEERYAFRQLLSISKVGPKAAVGILSGVTVEDLNRAVATGDATRLKAIPGIGPKTAQRLVMELKGKLGAEAHARFTTDSGGRGTGSVPSTSKIRSEAFEAMIALGYAEKQVGPALSRVENVIDADAPVEEWIRNALQVI